MDFDVVGNFTSMAEEIQEQALEKRGDPWFRNLWHTGMYVTFLYVGSNEQKLGALLDTGSSNLWFPDAKTLCKKINCGGHQYDPSTSSTAEFQNPDFEQGYFDGSSVKGNLYKDTIALGTCKNCARIKGAVFGDATDGVRPSGLGYWGIAPVSPGSGSNIIDLMKDQKLINTRGFSIYLNQASATSGSIIFGGYDKAKFSGDLGTLPLWDDSLLSVKLNSVTIGGKTTDIGTRALIDTGTGNVAFDKPTGDAVFAGFKGGHFSDAAGVYLVDCDANHDTVITLDFNGVSIDMLIGELYTEHMKDKQGNDVGCGFFINRLDFNLFGNTFLRNAVTVFNYDAKTISFGRVKYTDESNLVKL